MATLTLGRARRATPQFNLTSLSYTFVLVVVAVTVVYPVLRLIVSSFYVNGTWTLEAWRVALADPTILAAFWNTIQLTVAMQGIAFPIAILLAWILARTDIPGAYWLEFLFWTAFFLPALPVTLGWILMLDPEFGLLNKLVALLPFVDRGPFNIYSFWGIVWAHLAHSTIAVKVMLLTPAFRNLDASLEEASRVSGSSTLGTLFRIVVPVMTPILLVSLLLSVIHSLQAFEIEAVLGPPFRFFVFSTKIYTLIQQEPPLFGSATALGSMILFLMVPFIALQRWLSSRRKFTTVSGQFRGNKLQLRRWRIPVFLFVLTIALVITIVPFSMLLMGTFMRLFGFFELASPWTTANWGRVLGDPIFLNSLRNTFLLASGTAIIGGFLYSLIAYIAVRTRYSARGVLDFVSWLPSTFPGIILGLGLLWLFLDTPTFRPLYGTIAVLIIATLVNSMTLGVQVVKSNLVQFGFDLEEAARIGGGNWWDVYKHVVLPLLAPVLLLVGAMSFISASRNVSTVALLATSANRPMSLLQLDYMVEGRYEAGAVVGVLIVLLTLSVAVVARIVGQRFGVRH